MMMINNIYLALGMYVCADEVMEVLEANDCLNYLCVVNMKMGWSAERWQMEMKNEKNVCGVFGVSLCAAVWLFEKCNMH